MNSIDSKLEEELKHFESSGDGFLAKHSFEGAVEALNMYKKASDLLCHAMAQNIISVTDIKTVAQCKRKETEFKPWLARISAKMRAASAAMRRHSMKK